MKDFLHRPAGEKKMTDLRIKGLSNQFCILLASLCGLAGCDRVEGKRGAFAGSVPATIASAKMVNDGVICPLESINGLSIRKVLPISRGSSAQFVGWSTVADAEKPAPPMVHLVFRSQVVGIDDQFISGVRIKRPDIANGNQKLLPSGYLAQGLVPAIPGNYNVLIWVGDKSRQIECDTGISLAIR